MEMLTHWFPGLAHCSGFAMVAGSVLGLSFCGWLLTRSKDCLLLCASAILYLLPILTR